MSFAELLLIAIVALIVFGPRQMALLARDLGRWVQRWRQFLAKLQFDLDLPAREQQLRENIAKAQAAEAQQRSANVSPQSNSN